MITTIDLINRFIASELYVVGKLRELFKIHDKITGNNWTIKKSNILGSRTYNKNGIIIRPHGVGLEFQDINVWIDFDFGNNGEIDGFDPYRLFEYCTNNKIDDKLTINIIINDINDMIKENKIQKKDYYYYLTKGG